MIQYATFYLYDLCHFFTIKNEKRREKSLNSYEDCRLWFIGFIIDYDVFQFFCIFIFSFAIFWLSSLSCSWRHDAISENCYCPCITIVITKSIIRQQKK